MATCATSGARTTTIAVVGDCMLGRLVNHMLLRRGKAVPRRADEHIDQHSSALAAAWQAEQGAEEDSAHIPESFWPDTSAGAPATTIDFCSLANNHVLDFQAQGMRETMDSLTRVGIRFAGCGRNLAEASAPAFITLPGGNSSLPPIQLALFSAADHFKYWAATEDSPGIHLIDPERVTDADLHRIAGLVATAKERSARTLAVVCMHWGPNYAWHPSLAIRRLAHALIDRCGASLVIGTSAHHIQGVESHHGAPILYSCGDFIDDYRVDEEYRNDLSFLFHLHLDPVSCRFTSISLFPNAIRRMQASAHVSAEERRWLYSRMQQLCAAMGTSVTPVDRSLRQLEIVL
ncbi:unnamed protein product [Closterium sp. Yama58-4]|nr:unnamed protein product [Closterium sp. Yama58-4]